MVKLASLELEEIVLKAKTVGYMKRYYVDNFFKICLLDIKYVSI